MNFLKTACTAAAVVAAIALPGLASAQSTWNLGGSSCGAGSGTLYASLSCGVGSETATLTAWATTGGSGTALASGNLANWDPSGLGAVVGSDSTSTSTHAFDSTNPAGSTELMLIGFGPYKVSLNSIALGWYETDADVSILRYDGAFTSNAASLVSGKTTSQLLSSGWTLVGSESLTTKNFDNPNTTGSTAHDAYKSTINLGTTTSSYWIISTYFGSTTSTLNAGDDKFKILNFNATVSGVCADPTKTAASGCTSSATPPGGTIPEPTSLALVGLAGLGAFGLRRRARKAA